MKSQASARYTLGATTSVILAALLSVVAITPASAAEPPSATASGIKIASDSGLRFTVSASPSATLIERILAGTLQPVVQGLLNPLTALPSQLVGSLLAPIVSGSVATTPASGAPASASPFALSSGSSPSTGSPASCTATSGTCYHPALGLDLGLLKLSLIHGLTERVNLPGGGSKLVSQSQVAGVSIGNLLGLADIVRVDAAQSMSECSSLSSFSPEGTSSTAGVRLLGVNGGVPVIAVDAGDPSSGSALKVTIAGTQVLTVGTDIPISLPGITATARLDGDLLTVKVGLGLAQVLGSLGAGVLSSVLDFDAALTITVGGGSTTTSDHTENYGLAVGLGLGLNVSLLGLDVSTQGDATSNLLDIKLAHTNCSATGGTPEPEYWISPGLT